MGHRKHSAPRHGSLAFLPRGRAGAMYPRIRTWPDVEAEKPTLLGYPGYKAGTLHVITLDDRAKTPNFGKPLFNLSSVLSLPEAEVTGMRLYTHENGHDRAISDVKAQGQGTGELPIRHGKSIFVSHDREESF